MITPKLLPGNFTRGRGAMKPDVIVIHIQEGTMAGTDTWFRNPKSGVSAHYGVSKDGDIVQWVQDGDQAWHAGTVKNPTAEIVKARPAINPNRYTIGIENEGKATDDPPVIQLTALGELVRQLCAAHAIPLDRRHIIGHREIRADKTCPGKIDVDQVVAIARMGTPAPKDEVIRQAVAEIKRQVARIEAVL